MNEGTCNVPLVLLALNLLKCLWNFSWLLSSYGH